MIGGRPVHSCSFDKFWGASSVIGFIRDRLVHSGATRGSSGSFMLIQAHPGSRLVHSRSFRGAHGVIEFIRSHPGVVVFVCVGLVNAGTPLRSSFGRDPMVFGFIRVRWFIRVRPYGGCVRLVYSGAPRDVVEFICVRLVHSGAPQGWSSTFTFFLLILALPGCRRVHWGSFALFVRAPGVVGFISASFSEFGRTHGVVRFIRGCLVYSRVHHVSSYLFALAWFIPRGQSGRRVNSSAFLGSLGSFRFFSFFRAGPVGRRVHFRSFREFERAPAAVGFIRIGFVHSESRRPSGSFRRSPVVGFIRDCLVHLDAPRLSSGSFGYVWFIRAPPAGRRDHSVSLGSFVRALGVVQFIRVGLVYSGGVIGLIWVRLVHLRASIMWSV